MFENKDIEHLIFEYQGPFGIQIISGVAKFLSDNAIGSDNMRKRLHRVFIELAQNVALYSADRVQLFGEAFVGQGQVYITDHPAIFKCITINKVLKVHVPVLIKNCSEINAASSSDLKERKKNLHRLANSQDTGAHLGLIMIFTYSGNPLEFEIIEIDEVDVFFKITAVINK